MALSSTIMKWSLRALGLLIVFVPVLWALDVPTRLGQPLHAQQFLAPMLAFAIAATFIRQTPLRRRRDRGEYSVPMFYLDLFFALVAFVLILYLGIDYDRFLQEFAFATTEMIVMGAIILPLLFEAVRRSTGWLLFSIVIIFAIYAIFAQEVPAPLTGLEVSPSSLAVYAAFDSNSVLGVPLTVASTVVVVFIAFGALLLSAGGGDFFTDLAAATLGNSRGGSAKIAVGASALFGSISGSAVSNVATTGVITIPMMEKAGYQKEDAAAIESLASTGGQFLPPIMGAAAFLMAEGLEIDYQVVVIAALFPALLYYLSVFIQIHLIACRDHVAVPEVELPTWWRVLISGWQTLLPFVVLIVALFGYNVQIEEAAYYTLLAVIVGAFIQTYHGERYKLSKAIEAFWTAGMNSVQLLIIVAAAGFVLGVLNQTGIGQALTGVLIQFAGNSLFLLLLIGGFICIILGMGMPTTGVYLLLAPTVGAALITFGIDKLPSHMFILYFGMLSMITPPIALAAFTAASINNSGPMKTGFTAMRMGWVAYVIPFIFVLSSVEHGPVTLFLNGRFELVVWDIATTAVGIFAVGAAAVGYIFKPMNILPRIALIPAGLAAMVPTMLYNVGFELKIAGLLIIATVVGYELIAQRRLAQT